MNQAVDTQLPRNLIIFQLKTNIDNTISVVNYLLLRREGIVKLLAEVKYYKYCTKGYYVSNCFILRFVIESNITLING